MMSVMVDYYDQSKKMDNVKNPEISNSLFHFHNLKYLFCSKYGYPKTQQKEIQRVGRRSGRFPW